MTERGGDCKRHKLKKPSRCDQGRGSHIQHGNKHQECGAAYLGEEPGGRDGKQLKQGREPE